LRLDRPLTPPTPRQSVPSGRDLRVPGVAHKCQSPDRRGPPPPRLPVRHQGSGPHARVRAHPLPGSARPVQGSGRRWAPAPAANCSPTMSSLRRHRHPRVLCRPRILTLQPHVPGANARQPLRLGTQRRRSRR
jgi:hypothetical protein